MKYERPKKLFKMNFWIRFGDSKEYVNWNDLTPEQQKWVSQKLNEQAARAVVLNLADFETTTA